MHFENITQEQLCNDVAGGSIQRLIRCLHRCILKRPFKLPADGPTCSRTIEGGEGGYKVLYYYRNRVDYQVAMQVTVLCVGIDRALLCSEFCIEQYAHSIEWDLSNALPQVIKLFSLDNNDIDSMVRLLTLRNVFSIIRTMYKSFSVVSHAKMSTSLLDFVDQCMGSCCIRSETLTDAAYTIAKLTRQILTTNVGICKRVGETITALVPTLCKEYSMVSTSQLKDILDGLQC